MQCGLIFFESINYKTIFCREESTKHKNEAFSKSFEKVETKLNETRSELGEREDEVLLHQKVLKDRCEQFESLQNKNKSNGLKISRLKSEIKDKSDEIENLVFSLNEKQFEVESFKEIQKENNLQSRRIEELENKLTEAVDNASALESVLKSINESRRNYLLTGVNRICDSSNINIDNREMEFWKTQSKRIEQLENDLAEANVKAETYEQVLKNINESRRLYLVEYQKQRSKNYPNLINKCN